MDRIGTSIAACRTTPAGASVPDGMRVFFAHQSIGDNILDGVRRLAPSVRIVSGDTPPAGTGILETHIGRNGSPESKLHDFERRMEILGDHIDVAALKFCYCDFSRATDVTDVAARYRAALAALANRHPRTRFVHVTVPLTVVQTGPLAVAKRLFGRLPWGAAENRTRHAFNTWLRRTYPASEVFDLAGVECVAPSGVLITFNLDGAEYPSLYPGYSDDGQHLSARVRPAIAAAWLAFLERLGKRIS